MALRKRVPPLRRSPSPEIETISTKKKARKFPETKPKSGKRNALTDSDSESEKENGGAPSGYENIREQRIRENKERMEKLGIFSLSSKIFNSKKRPTKNPPKKKRYPSILPRPPRRKSDRLKDVARANYLKNERSLKEMGISITDGWKSEIYTKEDEKLLGDCEAKWTLGVDGIEDDGDLLYDPVNGTSCHQCRNRTLRKHTFCNKCRLGQGRLCGDCLYTRYGENVLEAVQNPKWLCPACRGICNCSRCRRDKGWLPVTIQYPKVIELGFKSIAHYIILNRHVGNTQKSSEDDKAVMVDLIESEKPTSPDYVCSDSSGGWSESDSDDSDVDNSKIGKKSMQQSVDEHVDIANDADKNEVQELSSEHFAETKN